VSHSEHRDSQMLAGYWFSSSVKSAESGSSLFRRVPFHSLGRERPLSTDGSDFHRCIYGFHPSVRSEKSAARTPKQLEFCIATGALSLPEGAEKVSRAAAKLCERPRSPKRERRPQRGRRTTARAHQNGLTPLPGRVVVFGETGGGARGARLPTGSLSAGPQGPAGRPSFSETGSRTFD
jgi:hypothetical protein